MAKATHLISYKKCITLEGDVDNGRDYTSVGIEGYGKALSFSLHFAENLELP